MKRRFGLFVIAICFSGLVWATQCPNNCYPINTVTYQMHASRWAATKTAKVIIQFNGALTTKGSADIEKTIYKKLNLLSSAGKWHITNISQTKDSSELQRINLLAEARMPSSNIAHLQDRVKKISKPGATFTVANIDFSPSLADIQAVKADLRAELYSMANAELQKLNKIYSSEHFSLHSMKIVDRSYSLGMRNNASRGMVLMKAAGAASHSMPMVVNRKVKLEATVQFASKLQ